jgi:hypothetical protein
MAQNTVALSVFGAFGGTTTGNNIQQSPANAAGGMAELRHISNPLIGYAGLDWGLVPHIGLRFQYRGNLYQAPDLTRLYTSSNAFTHTAEPMIGAYFRF